jgi:hypothetical protein
MQAKVMFLIESEQYKSQHKNLTPPSRAKEGRRIHDKFFDPRAFSQSVNLMDEQPDTLTVVAARTPFHPTHAHCAGSQFDVSADVTPEVLVALKAQCSSPSSPFHPSQEPSPEAFDAARVLIQEDILRGR